MEERKLDDATDNAPPACVPAYRKPQLKKLGGITELTRASTIFSNIADSSNVLGSDYS